MSTQAIVDQTNYYPSFAVQEFNTEWDRQWDTERYYFRPMLDEIFNSMDHNVNVNNTKPSMEHAFVFTPNGGEIEVVQKVPNFIQYFLFQSDMKALIETQPPQT